MTGINYEDLLDLSCLQVISDLNTQLSASDPDVNMPSKVNFDYYSIPDFNSSIDIQNSVSHRAFSILNCNIRSLNANFDHLTLGLPRMFLLHLSARCLLMEMNPITTSRLPLQNPSFLRVKAKIKSLWQAHRYRRGTRLMWKKSYQESAPLMQRKGHQKKAQKRGEKPNHQE